MVEVPRVMVRRDCRGGGGGWYRGAATGGVQASWARREGRTVAGRRPESPPLGGGERGMGCAERAAGTENTGAGGVGACWSWCSGAHPSLKKLFCVFGCAGSAVLSAGFL